MSDEHFLTRRAFTLESVLAILSAATITITGCGGYEMGPSPPPGDREGVVSSNHGHRAIVTAAQLNSNNTVTVDMRYQATHNHTLTLTPSELGAISENARVAKTSSTDDDHSHTVTFN
jgi:hypothetical protein